jgi:hypothetical protein
MNESAYREAARQLWKRVGAEPKEHWLISTACRLASGFRRLAIPEASRRCSCMVAPTPGAAGRRLRPGSRVYGRSSSTGPQSHPIDQVPSPTELTSYPVFPNRRRGMDSMAAPTTRWPSDDANDASSRTGSASRWLTEAESSFTDRGLSDSDNYPPTGRRGTPLRGSAFRSRDRAHTPIADIASRSPLTRGSHSA